MALDAASLALLPVEQAEELEALSAIYGAPGEFALAAPLAAGREPALRLRLQPSPEAQAAAGAVAAAAAAKSGARRGAGAGAGAAPPPVVWVAATLAAAFPPGYPAAAQARLELLELRGVGEQQREELQALLASAQADCAGAPCVFAAAEAVREWLNAHNEKPSDGSAFDEMMREKAGLPSLQASGGAKARGYLADRALGPQIQAQFQLGYAPDEKFALRDHLAVNWKRGASMCSGLDEVNAGHSVALQM